jgi:putative component of membrane protein insertase Oxa1/YidC/SpoIIIJ protein YidD
MKAFCLAAILVLSAFGKLPAQGFSQDDHTRLLQSMHTEAIQPDRHKHSFLAIKPQDKFNPLPYVFGSLLFFYQHVLSEQLQSHCNFHPSCSEFSKQCIAKYGLAHGALLTADRLMRCNGSTRAEYPAYKLNPADRIIDHPDDYREP